MPTEKLQLKTYIDKLHKAKFSYISDLERRSDSNLLEIVILKYLDEYEGTHGELIVEEDGTVHQKQKSINDKWKLSISKVC